MENFSVPEGLPMQDISLYVLRCQFRGKIWDSEMAVSSPLLQFLFLAFLALWHQPLTAFDCPGGLVTQKWCIWVVSPPGQSKNSGAVDFDVPNPMLEIDCPEPCRAVQAVQAVQARTEAQTEAQTVNNQPTANPTCCNAAR
jgi:hypothetical protein